MEMRRILCIFNLLLFSVLWKRNVSSHEIFLEKYVIKNLRYFAKNLNWPEEQLGDDEDDYFLFDCPGNYKNT